MASQGNSLSLDRSDSNGYPKEYKFKCSQDSVRSFKDPHNPELQIHHVYMPIRDFAHGELPDDVNPRSHEYIDQQLKGRIPKAIGESVEREPTVFHLLNRGLLILAQRCWYDNRAQQLHIAINSEKEGGVADGATTDRVLKQVRAAVADLENIPVDQLPEHLRDAYVHLEIISGTIGDEMLVQLTRARNASLQVKEFALEHLGGGFDWLRDLLDGSEFKGRIRYRENDEEPVDILTVLSLLTLFHPKWNEDGKEPLIAFSSKGNVLQHYRDPEWRAGYELLKPVVLDILRFSDFVQVEFRSQYNKYKGESGQSGKLGKRKEVRYKDGKTFTLPLTEQKTTIVIPDGWLYPILGSFRMLLVFPKKGSVRWITDPQLFFKSHGAELVGDVVEQSEALGRNPAATGKSRPVWNALRKSMELHRMKLEQGQSVATP
jgi:hypothetical protein